MTNERVMPGPSKPIEAPQLIGGEWVGVRAFQDLVREALGNL